MSTRTAAEQRAYDEGVFEGRLANLESAIVKMADAIADLVEEVGAVKIGLAALQTAAIERAKRRRFELETRIAVAGLYLAVLGLFVKGG